MTVHKEKRGGQTVGCKKEYESKPENFTEGKYRELDNSESYLIGLVKVFEPSQAFTTQM